MSTAFAFWRHATCAIALGLMAAAIACAQDRDPNANSLLAEMARDVRAVPYLLACDLNVEVHAFRQTIIGTGSYKQCPVKNELLVFNRLELTLTQQRKAFFQLNRNGNETIIQHNLHGGNDFVGRISLRRLREAPATVGSPSAIGNAATTLMAPLDGLASSLDAIANHFQLGKIQTRDVEGTRFLVMRGGWKLSSLPLLMKEGQTRLPEQIPDAVEVVVETNASDQLARFPRSLVFLKRQGKGDAERLEPMVAIRFENLELAEANTVNVQSFQVQINEKKVVDLTDQFLARLPPKEPR